MHSTTSEKVRVLTVTMSDTRTPKNDESGRILVEELTAAGLSHVKHIILREEPRFLQELLLHVSTDSAADAVVITGGTGIGPRDVTYEAVREIFHKELTGFGEAFRRLSWEDIGPRAILSRATAGVVQECVVFAIPGSPMAVRLAVRELIAPTVAHAVRLATGHTRHDHEASEGGRRVSQVPPSTGGRRSPTRPPEAKLAAPEDGSPSGRRGSRSSRP